jgi:hypothetical protein
MTSTCIRCGKNIRDKTVYHSHRRGDIDYSHHAYDCTRPGCHRIVKENLVATGCVICRCGYPLIPVTSSIKCASNGCMPSDYLPPFNCPRCHIKYDIKVVLETLVPNKITVAPPAYVKKVETPSQIYTLKME